MINDLLRGWKALEAAKDDYDDAARYYDGKIDEVFASPRIQAELSRTGERYRFNLAKVPVNTLADRVEISAITVDGDDTANGQIEQDWDANNLDVVYPDLITKTLKFGDGYLMVWPLPEDESASAGSLPDLELIESGVEITYHEPTNTRVMYDPENARRKAFTIKRWPIDNPRQPGSILWRADLYYPEVIEHWVSTEAGNPTEPQGWREWQGELGTEDPTDENPFGEIPFFHYRTALPYGVAVHADAYGPQDALNKMLITQLTTTDSHGFPQRYALVDPAGSLDSNHENDGTDDLTTAPGTVRSGRPSGMRSGPGTVQEWEGMSEVGQFAAAEPAAFLDPAAFYVRLMATMTNTPLHYFDPSGDVPSGESLKTAEAPLVKTAEKMHRMLTSAVIETWRFVLLVHRMRITKAVEVRWKPASSATGLGDWETVQAKIDTGVPQKVALVEAGYEEPTVDEWLDEQQEAMDLGRRVALLDSLATALQKLAAVSALGQLDAGKLQAIIDSVMGEKIVSGQPKPEPDPAGQPPANDPRRQPAEPPA